MDRIKVFTPAKINLGLNVIRKRSDGYHDLETIFYPINLFDELEFIKSGSLRLVTNSEVLNKEDDNLVLKAVRLLESEFGISAGYEIHLTKNIPIGAGLGGGSSDAAAVLKLLSNIYELNIPKAGLLELALKLGSDVPFFIDPEASFAKSRGEVLKKVDIKINYPVLIVNPGIHVSTREAFGKITPAEPDYPLSEVDVSYFNDPELLKRYITNDFEAPVFSVYPEIGAIKDKFYESGAMFSLMTGTGSTVFGIYQNLKDAEDAYNSFNKNYFRYIHYEN